MTPRDLCAIAFRTTSLWLFASGTANLVSGLITWRTAIAASGAEIAANSLAASSMLVPIGAMLWLSSDTLASWAFPHPAEASTIGLTRQDLYAFASALVGLLLMSEAIVQIAYWVVVWRASGPSMWEGTSGEGNTTVEYWAQAGVILTKLVLGTILLFGPRRLTAAVQWLRGELTGKLDDPTEPDQERGQRDGGQQCNEPDEPRGSRSKGAAAQWRARAG